MKELKKKFLLSKQINPSLGDYIHLSKTIKNTGTDRATIMRLFNAVISKDEFEKNEKAKLIEFLVIQSQNTPLTK